MSDHDGTLDARHRMVSRRSHDEEQAIWSHNNAHALPEKPTVMRYNAISDAAGMYRFWDRFTRKGKKQIGVLESLRAIVFSSWLNLFIIFIPLAWVSHFKTNPHHPELGWPPSLTFTLCFLAIIPLERLFDYGGEQMSFYCGKDLGDLIIISLNNAVEATLAIMLLIGCDLKLLQSTIIGVVILHLLLIPGMSFITGGARIMQQELHPHYTQLNHTLLTIGVLALLLPAAFFSALDRAAVSAAETTAQSLVSDATRLTFLKMSRGLAIILLAVYICSRIFLHNPPGEDNALREHPLAPEEHRHEEEHLAKTDPEVNQWVCIVMLIISIGIMAATAEWLVRSIEFVREAGQIEEEWFGLILLPFVSFAADGAVALAYFVRYQIRFFFGEPPRPATLAKARAIDLSIQFTLLWMPFIILLGWWTNKPISLLFDSFEVSILLGACFIVNYVTADAKTNWAEGFAMVSFYIMIALCSWFYTGQPNVRLLLSCPGSVQDAIAAAASGTVEASHR